MHLLRQIRYAQLFIVLLNKIAFPYDNWMQSFNMNIIANLLFAQLFIALLWCHANCYIT